MQLRVCGGTQQRTQPRRAQKHCTGLVQNIGHKTHLESRPPAAFFKTAATMSDDIMNKRQKAIDEHYEAQWDTGKGSHHPDYDPEAVGDGVAKANRETEELLNAIIKVRAPTTLPRPSSRDPRSA